MFRLSSLLVRAFLAVFGFGVLALWLLIVIAGPFGGDRGGGLIGVAGFWPGMTGDALELRVYWTVLAVIHATAIACLWSFVVRGATDAELRRPGSMALAARSSVALCISLVAVALIAGLLPGWYSLIIRGPKRAHYPYLLWWPLPPVLLIGLFWASATVALGCLRGGSGFSQRCYLALGLLCGAATAIAAGLAREPSDLHSIRAYYPPAPSWEMGFNTATVLGLGCLAWSAFALLLILSRFRSSCETRCGFAAATRTSTMGAPRSVSD